MKCSAFLVTWMVLGGWGWSQTLPAPRHEANFDAERKQANDLFLAEKTLEALPLYEDLCRQDKTISVFAERHGAGLFAKESTIADAAERAKVHQAGIAEIRRAQALGDNSNYVQAVLGVDARTPIGAILSNVPLTVGYTYGGNAAAQAVLLQAESAFAHTQLEQAAKLYEQAAALDPAWYSPALYAGDTYFRLKDLAKVNVWFAKAVAIDPDRETAYRYWGDALYQSGDKDGARLKFVQAVVAEPYGKPAYVELKQWGDRTGHQMVTPAITRPEFTAPNGILQVDPALAASTQDGRSSWLVYQQYRVAHGAGTLNQLIVAGASSATGVLTPNGYRHTVAEEHAALRAMLADLEAKIKAGTLVEANLDPSLRNVRALEKANVLGAWIAISAADAGIRSDYPEYRGKYREHLADYVNVYLIQ